MEKNTFRFDSYVVPGETSSVETGGYVVTARIVFDDDTTPPWERYNGHGLVSAWTSRAKRPGERVLCEDHGQRRLYDVQAAMQIAKRDGWGWLPAPLIIERDKPSQGDGTTCGGRATSGEFTAYNADNFNAAIGEVYNMHKASMPRGEYIAKAVERDFEVLQAWCCDEWFYCGIVLSTSYNGHEILENAAALWGIECNYPGSDNTYLAEVAQELLSEAISESEKERQHIIADISAA